MAKLPKWLSQRADGAFVIDPDIAYPIMLRAMGVNEADADQYWIECAYQCSKMEVQNLITGTELDPRPKMGFVIVIDSSGGRKDRWALRNFKPGKPGCDINAATKGLQAKQHYARIAARLRA